MDPESAYVGPRPFERKDESIFFGRDHETNQLASLVIAQKEVLLYAASGAGKTSLINAKLWPLLEEEGFEILPPARVRGVISEPQTPNIFVFHSLMSWAEDVADANRLAEMRLCDFLDRRLRLSDKEGSPKPRLIIFDQFEELFTVRVDRWQERHGFFEQVADALNNDSMLRSLFVMRADYIARLDRYARIMPQKFRTRFCLEALREDGAMAAVVRPAMRCGRSFATGVA
jgi:hypothetical protein